MPEIKVTRHIYRDNSSLHTHAREEKLWFGPKMILWITYDGFHLQLVIRRDEDGKWEAANVFHGNTFLNCPFCKKKNMGGCEKAGTYMAQLAEDVLNHPSFRLIALFEM